MLTHHRQCMKTFHILRGCSHITSGKMWPSRPPPSPMSDFVRFPPPRQIIVTPYISTNTHTPICLKLLINHMNTHFPGLLSHLPPKKFTIKNITNVKTVNSTPIPPSDSAPPPHQISDFAAPPPPSCLT